MDLHSVWCHALRVTGVAAALLAPSLALATEPATAFPAIIMNPTPALAMEVWDKTAADPAAGFAYLDRDRLRARIKANLSGPSGISIGNRILTIESFTVKRIGDVGRPGDAAALDEYAETLTKRGELDGATTARLSAERIRWRQRGREAYIQEMVRWLAQPDYSLLTGTQASMDATRRVLEGARALGVLKAVEAVPALLEVCVRPSWRYGNSFYVLRALARIGDPRSLDVMATELKMLIPLYAQPHIIPLEPDEPDLVAVYWAMRTRDMTPEAATADMMRSLGEPLTAFADRMLIHVGAPAVRQLIGALEAPPPCRTPVRVVADAARILGELREREAVPPLRRVLNGLTQAPDWARDAAAVALGKIGDPAALPDLLRLATSDDEAMLACVLVLRSFADPRVAAVLMGIVKGDKPVHVRGWAAHGLRDAGDATTAEEAARWLPQEKDPSVRTNLEFVIRKFGRRLGRQG